MPESQSYPENPSSVLRQYVDGRLTTSELDAWLSEAEYDDSVPAPIRDLLASVRLVIVEAGEGLATKDDVLTTVALALASMDPQNPILMQRANSSTTWNEASSSLTATATPVVRGRISAGTGA
jgi:hypothetical protein